MAFYTGNDRDRKQLSLKKVAAEEERVGGSAGASLYRIAHGVGLAHGFVSLCAVSLSVLRVLRVLRGISFLKHHGITSHVAHRDLRPISLAPQTRQKPARQLKEHQNRKQHSHQHNQSSVECRDQ